MASYKIQPTSKGKKSENILVGKCDTDKECPYFAQLKTYKYSSDALEHFDTSSHTMIHCRHGKQCHAFQRLVEGEYRLDDRGHCAVYRHPCRRDNAHIEKSLGSNKFISAPLRIDSKQHYNHVEQKPIENAFEDIVVELMLNGFNSVMMNKQKKTLWDIAKDKMEHPRHINLGKPLSLEEILAILIYTGTDAYKSLRYDEMLFWNGPLKRHPTRVKDYYQNEESRKWPILSFTLSKAIFKLYLRENHMPAVTYHGLNNVEVDPTSFDCMKVCKLDQTSTKIESKFMYGTFVSTSTDRDVAVDFIKSVDERPRGCLMQIEVNLDCIGADVSWISKFPSEREFLIDKCQGFQLKSNYFDEKEQFQIVELTRIPEKVDIVPFSPVPIFSGCI